MDAARRCRLLSSVSTEKLLQQVITEAEGAAADNPVCAHWREATKRKGYLRVESTVPLKADTFDLLINGRMGYRAQYYLSVDDGRRFNRRLVNSLTPLILTALENGRCGPPVECSRAENSLKAPHSKVWVAGDWAAFIHEPELLKPARWVKYWGCTEHKPIGLSAPLPCKPKLELKGTFICEKTGEPWLPSFKKDRDQEIHCSGWT